LVENGDRFMSSIHRHNQKIWDEKARNHSVFATPATAEDLKNPLERVDQCGWLGGSVKGKKILCLAAGGGRHSVLFAAAGAEVTVVDISGKMLELDRKVALETGLKFEIIQASMDRLTMIGPDRFDIVVQPVSTCYVPEIGLVYLEVARVLKMDGLYISQHKQPASLQSFLDPGGNGYVLSEPYFRKAPLPPVQKPSLLRERGAVEFLHRWDQLLGELCKSGFVIENIAEPRHGRDDAAPGSFEHRCFYLPPYIKIKARKIVSKSVSGLVVV
jgi:SAM-dependent methyltransferase